MTTPPAPASPLRPPWVILDFPGRGPAPTAPARRLLFRDPVRVVCADRAADVPAVLEAVERAAREGMHAVGFVSYEAAPAFDDALAAPGRTPLPLAWFGLFERPEIAGDLPAAGETGASAWAADTTPAEHAEAVRAIHEAIGRGDVYQVTHTIRLRAALAGDPLALYRRMRDAQPSAFGAYMDLGRHCILSASPELFFHRRGDAIETRPMKGTAPRGRWLEEDDAAAARLAASAKERAENVMIADLLRNDLGRIARPGTVRAPRLFEVERHPTVLQMTSTVEAALPPGTSLARIFGALFPCGSVTGAPKVAATRAIAALERSPRGIYCGAIGHVAPSGEATFSVAIRTAWVDREAGAVEYGTGGGITWDSAAAAEYDELLAKAAVVTTELPRMELLETLRLTSDGYARRERHLARLAASARYFGIPVRMAEVERALDAHARSAPAGPRRVRLLVAPDGVPRVEDRPLVETGDAEQPVALAGWPVSSADRFLFHKTTHRAVYDRHRAAHPEAFDVLLWNESGELTEFTIGNLVLELDGARWTPPRSCGLLAGTYRAELLEQGALRERRLTGDDLRRAGRVWLINSLRGWVPVRIRP